jgi:hypothetical protein
MMHPIPLRVAGDMLSNVQFRPGRFIPAATVVLLCAAPLAALGGTRFPQENRSRAFGPGRCGPADPTAIRVSSYTGGQPYFLSPSELGRSSRIMDDVGRSNIELVLWASAASAGATREFTVPVDASIEWLTVSASFDAQGGRLMLPDLPAGTEKEETIFNCVHIVAINRPAAGPISIQVVGTGRFWLRVRAQTALSLSSVEFVRAGGRPGHEGLFRIDGEPVAGRLATLRLRIREAAGATRKFVALSADGRVLQALELAEVDDEEYVGSFVPPDEPFRIAVTGVDASGLPYQRVHGFVFHAERFEIAPVETGHPVRAGELTPVSFVVRNHDRQARYRIVGSSGGKIADRVEPAILDLDEGAEGTVTVWITVPADAVPGRSLDVRMTATKDDDVTRFNSGVHRLTVADRPIH